MNIGVCAYSKTHRDLFVYHYANDVWVRFACQLKGMDRCTGPSWVSHPEYQRTARGNEEAQAIDTLRQVELGRMAPSDEEQCAAMNLPRQEE